ncbi:hypothetical protein [Streptomyces sp. NBC_01235]|uniref:hypothetical protein n=1 Tax=Streptomyces sp. NBC_01235 TaxID=2903788 RepID=UPI002E138CD1|nr:hypothetical protein OG289_00035 [Streptomyces sp. NBC_01235]WSP86604.1 hypothetical protein OG289_49475 [Streptomyces sp. NBC_01235]
MDERSDHCLRLSKAPELADGSPLSVALTDLGEPGVRALGLLRSADRLLTEEQEWERRSEIVISCCRGAVEGLLKLAGKESEFIGTGSTGRELSARLKVLLNARRSSGALEKLEAELDALGSLPAELTSKDALFTKLKAVVAARGQHKAPVANPSAVFEARAALAAEVDALDALPDRLSEGDAVFVRLRELFEARKAHEAFLRDALAAEFEAVEEAFAAFTYEQANGWEFRARKVSKLVHQQTRREPGAVELQAIKAWSDFYQDANVTVHGESADTELAASTLHKIIAAVEQLFVDLPARAPRLRELVNLSQPTQEEADEVSRITDPRANSYFFEKATSSAWLDLLPENRLLPESDRWTAASYFERLAAKDPERVLAWLDARLNAITKLGPAATAQTVRLARVLGAAASAFVLRLVKTSETDGLLLDIHYWAVDVPARERNGQWVSVVTRVLKSAAATSWLDPWEAQQALEHLKAAGARPEDGGPEISVANLVRQGLAEVMAAGLNSPDGVGEFEVENDLRSVGATHPGDSLVRLIARACLDFARYEAGYGLALGVRTRQWSSGLPAGPVLDRLVAVHLLEVPPGNESDVWWEAALGVISRIGAMRRTTADLADFLRAVNSACSEARSPQMEAALANGLGAPPDAAGLEAGLQALKDRKPLPTVRTWFMVWSLSPILPASVLALWQPVLDLFAERFGTPPERPAPRWEVVSVERVPEDGFAELSAAAGSDGAVAAARMLAAAAEPGDTSRERDDEEVLLSTLVSEAPETWMADPEQVSAELVDLHLQAAYFAALENQITAGRTSADAETIRRMVLAMWDLIPVADSPAGDAEAAQRLERSFCRLLHTAWSRDVDLGETAAEVAVWLDGIVAAWTAPTQSTADPADVMSNSVGGLALLALIRWGSHRSRVEGAPPVEMTARLDAILDAAPDDRALAAIGWALTPLHRHARRWFADHRAELLSLDDTWRPARTWLKHLPVNVDVFGQIDPDRLQALLCSPDIDQEAFRCAHAFLIAPDVLGPIEGFVSALAQRAAGPAAVSRLLSRTARILPKDGSGEDLNDNAFRFWRAVLALEVPEGHAHLHGAGAFSFAVGLDDQTWLDLTRRTVEQTPLVEAPDHVARRAARHPQSTDARAILTGLLPLYDGAAPSDLAPYRGGEIVRNAFSAWQASAPGSEGRKALGEALARHGGIVDAAIDE